MLLRSNSVRTGMNVEESRRIPADKSVEMRWRQDKFVGRSFFGSRATRRADTPQQCHSCRSRSVERFASDPLNTRRINFLRVSAPFVHECVNWAERSHRRSLSPPCSQCSRRVSSKEMRARPRASICQHGWPRLPAPRSFNVRASCFACADRSRPALLDADCPPVVHVARRATW